MIWCMFPIGDGTYTIVRLRDYAKEQGPHWIEHPVLKDAYPFDHASALIKELNS